MRFFKSTYPQKFRCLVAAATWATVSITVIKSVLCFATSKTTAYATTKTESSALIQKAAPEEIYFDDQIPLFAWGADDKSPLYTGSQQGAKILQIVRGGNISDAVATEEAIAVRVALNFYEGYQFMESLKTKTSVRMDVDRVANASRKVAMYVVWGNGEFGGNITGNAAHFLKLKNESFPLDDHNTTVTDPDLKKHVFQANDVCALTDAFVAIANDRIVCWGRKETCDGWESIGGVQNKTVPGRFPREVHCLRQGHVAMIIWSKKGSDHESYVSILGDKNRGGTFPETESFRTMLSKSALHKIVELPAISCHILGFAANEKAVVLVGNGGKAYAWGDQAAGGQIPESVANEFITKIVANSVGFAALKATGGVISWGQFEQRYIPKRVTNPKKVKVTEIVTSRDCFIALLEDNSIAMWGAGDELYCNENGATNSKIYIPFRNVKNSLSSNVLRVVASDDAFCAVKSDGSVITWGNRENGGDQQPKDLSNPDWDVQAIRWADPDSLQATCCAFGFLRKDGGVASWGAKYKGGIMEAESRNELILKLSATNTEMLLMTNDGSLIGNRGNIGRWYPEQVEPTRRIPGKVTHLLSTKWGVLGILGKDCELASGGAWSTCSASCGGGNRTREQLISKPSLNGYCPVDRLELQPCNTQACPEPTVKISFSLSTGQIIGIAAGGVCAVGLLGWMVVACCCRRRTLEPHMYY